MMKILSFLSKLFGSKNEREIKRLTPLVRRINQLEEYALTLSDAQMQGKTLDFKKRIAMGEPIDSLLPEAFAVVREAGRRALNMRHFDVQLLGGTILYYGSIAEMKTGEGKTLVATLPLYLKALEGKGAHLITVNDYLAKRDAEWNRPLYNMLGMDVGIIQNHMGDADRKKAYNADITYGTNNEFGFDYLRDNMKFRLNDYVQRELFYGIVDEVDSILIDEARTPLIISGQTERELEELYIASRNAVSSLKMTIDFEVDEKVRSVHLTEAGIDKVETSLRIKNLYAPENVTVVHHVQQALKAYAIFKRDIDYVVRDGQVFIVDEFTGRILPGRRYSDGLHQALEAKEGVKIERENQTLASITLQNYFRLYKGLAGMTGTAQTEAAEFYKIYKMNVVSVPTHKPTIRIDEPDIVFLTKEDKFEAVVADITTSYQKGQPVLVGTIAIETSEHLSHLLTKNGIPHNVLNAKQHEREADIIKEAGEAGKVTIATNMAGRGTDIKLSPQAREAGGLRIIGTERHESRRIDNQLRGRSGRQGDPGSSKFYLSLEDDLMRIFGGERMKQQMVRFGMKKGESIEHNLVSSIIERSQEKVEKHNFESRKNLIEYDDVLNQQRSVIYAHRLTILQQNENCKQVIQDMLADFVQDSAAQYIPEDKCSLEERKRFFQTITQVTGVDVPQEEGGKLLLESSNTAHLQEKTIQLLWYKYETIRQSFNEKLVGEAEKWLLLQTIDTAWKRHLQTIDHLKEGIGLRGYGYKNPLIEYKRESFAEFTAMMKNINLQIIQMAFKMKAEDVEESIFEEIEQEKEKELSSITMGSSDEPETKQPPVKREGTKVGRNDACPCGSTKKYKQCCGK